MICEEFTTQEIADKVFKSKRTVETIRTNLLQKTGAKNIAGLVMYAIKNEIIT
jgi:DNA-binding NarL/FixJ family response regulator